MTYDQFLDIIKDLLELDDYCPYTYEKIFGDDWRSNKEEYVIFVEWDNGGVVNNIYSRTKSIIYKEDEPDFDELDDILERIEPNISYLKYKKPMMKRSTYGFVSHLLTRGFYISALFSYCCIVTKSVRRSLN
jgi:hypothetical protein